MASRKRTKTEATDSPDRRRARRFPVGWAAVIKGLDATGLAFEETSTVKDLSSSGVFVYSNHQVPVGSKLDVLIRVPMSTEHWMLYPGRVIRVEPSQAQPGIAIKFSTFKPTFKPSFFNE